MSDPSKFQAALSLAIIVPWAAFSTPNQPPLDGLRMDKAEAWAPHALAAPVVEPQADGTVVIAANGTRTCSGGWQFVYTGVRGGQSYRLQAHVAHSGVASPWDALVALVYWTIWDPNQAKTSGALALPYDHLLPMTQTPNSTDFENVVTAPVGATALTIRYVFRWTVQGSSTWSPPTIEPVTIATSPPVKICVVSDTRKSAPPVSVLPFGAGLGLPEEIEKSVDRWASLILEACERKPQLIVIPETVIGGRDPLQDGAITVPGPATRPFERIAREYNVHLVLGVYERDHDAYYNSTVLIDPRGGVVGVYRKFHLASSEGWSGVSPGDNFPVFDTTIGRIGSMICMDSMLSESTRLLALNGAEFVCLPIKGDLRADRLTPGPPNFHEDRWKAIMRTRALDNQVTLVVARNDGQGSCIIDRRGDIVAWNDGTERVIEATIPSESIRYWAGGDLREVTYLLRRPNLYKAYTDESAHGPFGTGPLATPDGPR